MQARPRPDSPAIDVDGSVRLPGTAVRSGESGPRARTRPNPRQRFGRSGTRPARFHLRRSSAPAIGAVRAPSVRRAHLDPMAERSTSLGATRVRCHVARRGRRCVRCGRSRRRAVAPCAQDPGSRRSASPGNPAAQRRRRVPGLFEKPSLCRDHLICTVPKRRVSNVRRVSSVRLTGAARRSRRSAHLVSVRVFATFASDPIRRGRRCAFESSTPMSRHSKKSQRRGRGSGNDQGREAATAAAPQRRMTGGSRLRTVNRRRAECRNGSLIVNGVDVVTFVDAELDRQFPGREMQKAQTPEAREPPDCPVPPNTRTTRNRQQSGERETGRRPRGLGRKRPSVVMRRGLTTMLA